MKNIFKQTLLLLLPASLLLPATGCDDFLDKRPENSVDTEEVDYSNLANMYMPVSGLYSVAMWEGCHWMAHALTIVRDPDVTSYRTDDQAPLIDFGNYVYDRTFWGFNEVFRTCYQIVMNANTTLESLDKYAAYITDEDLMDTYRSYCGEARYLRAYAYFRLMQNFGTVPILENNLQTSVPLRKKTSVEKYLLDELQFCSNVLPALRPNEVAEHPGAVTKYTALHLKAKIHLERGEWNDAKLCTDSIIDSQKFSLYPDFYELFKIPGKICNESLLEFQTTDFGNPAGGEVIWTNCFFDYLSPSVTNVADPTKIYGGWNFCAIEEEAQEWVESRGETVRAVTTILKSGEETPSGDLIAESNPARTFFGKYYTPIDEMTPGGWVSAGVNNNVRVFRYADVLLINSEAKIRLGEDGDYGINLVRELAQMEPITGATLQDVWDERRMEFMSEWGEYYFDIIRTGRAAECIPAEKNFTEDKTYYPIPLEQIDLNPLLAEPAVD